MSTHLKEGSKLSNSKSKAKNGAGIWEIRDVYTEERISKFRARKRSDVDRMLRMASVGLKRPLTDFEAVYLTDWE
jgi:hypothetical protein